MFPIDDIHNIRELDIFMFGCIPETPESMYERDFHDFSESRLTREPIMRDMDIDNRKEKKIGEIKFDYSKGNIKLYNSDKEIVLSIDESLFKY